MASGIDIEGRKHLLHLASRNKESEDCWVEFFRHVAARLANANLGQSLG